MELTKVLPAIGYIGIFAIIFAESGLFFGFFFPGDSLLFTAGFLASQNIFDIWILIIGCFIAAILGDNVGYSFGKRVGPKIFKKDNSLFFHKNHILKAQEFYKKHGRKTIVIARFLPIVRTFAPIVAGVGTMNYRTFFVFNVIGGFLWAVGVILAGFFLGNLIPNVDKYLIPIIILIVVLSITPQVIHLVRDKEMQEDIKKFIAKYISRKN